MRAMSPGVVAKPVGLPMSVSCAGRLRQAVSNMAAGRASQPWVIPSSVFLVAASSTVFINA